MASDSPIPFGDSSFELEDMEMTELDADTLMKLLEEEPAGGEVQEGGGGCGVIQPPPGWTTEESDGGSSHKKEEEVVGNGYEWVLDVATEMSPAPPCAEVVGGEMLDMGEYGLDYYYYYYYQWYNNNNYNSNGAVLVEETAFEEGLWQNSY